MAKKAQLSKLAPKKQVAEGRSAEAAAPVRAIEPAAVTAAAQSIDVLKREQRYEGARLAWYAALVAHDGQSAEAFVAACTKQPPTTPKSGKAEDPRGWLRFFVREGVAKLASRA